MHSNGYILVADRHHPFANAQGLIYEHRKVLYDAIGDGVHHCHWCGCEVRWIMKKCRKGCLVPDHLDGDKANNARDNLVPACNACNAIRGLFIAWVMKHKDDPWLWQMFRNAVSAASRIESIAAIEQPSEKTARGE